MENVAAVMALMKPEWLEKKIANKSHCQTLMTECGDQSIATAGYYIHSYPKDPWTWRKIAKELYNDKDTPLPALEKLRQFLPPIGIV